MKGVEALARVHGNTCACACACVCEAGVCRCECVWCRGCYVRVKDKGAITRWHFVPLLPVGGLARKVFAAGVLCSLTWSLNKICAPKGRVDAGVPEHVAAAVCDFHPKENKQTHSFGNLIVKQVWLCTGNLQIRCVHACMRVRQRK